MRFGEPAQGKLSDSPLASVFFNQLEGRRRSPSAGRIVWEGPGWQGFPDVENGVNDGPSGLHCVGPLEKGGIPDHAVVKQTLISGSGLHLKVVGIAKIHIHGPYPHLGTGNFHPELQRNRFIWLYVHDNCVWSEFVYRSVSKHNQGDSAKLNHDFAEALRKP